MFSLVTASSDKLTGFLQEIFGARLSMLDLILNLELKRDILERGANETNIFVFSAYSRSVHPWVQLG